MMIKEKITDRSLRLTVHGEFPGVPPTILKRVINIRSSRFPHSLNTTLSAQNNRTTSTYTITHVAFVG